MESFLAARGATVGPTTPGASVPASSLRQQLDGIARHRNNAGDALNIAEAAGMKADLFITADVNTVGATFGRSGSIELPRSGGESLRFLVVGGG